MCSTVTAASICPGWCFSLCVRGELSRSESHQGRSDLESSNNCEPWDMPKRAKMREKEWYFFCVKDRKYPTGMRTNTATEAGYRKATRKDKEITEAKFTSKDNEYIHQKIEYVKLQGSQNHELQAL